MAGKWGGFVADILYPDGSCGFMGLQARPSSQTPGCYLSGFSYVRATPETGCPGLRRPSGPFPAF